MSENLRLSRSSELRYDPKQDAIKLRLIAFTLDKARMYSALYVLNHAIARLGEKALRGGGKSEDQPLSVECRTTLDVRAKRRK